MGYQAGSKEANKGKFGEKIVFGIFESNGINIKKHREGGHAFDFFLPELGHFGDIKTQERMVYYNTTGICCKHYRVYLEWQKANPMLTFYLYFVDYSEKCIYRQTLKKLTELLLIGGTSYPDENTNYGRGCRMMFHLSSMEFYKPLSEYEIEELKRLTSKEYPEPKKRHFKQSLKDFENSTNQLSFF